MQFKDDDIEAFRNGDALPKRFLRLVEKPYFVGCRCLMLPTH